MKLSVIILNYNVRYFLELCLLSVRKAIKNMDAEIIVVDNNSDDDSSFMIRNRFPEVKLIPNKENLGFARGNNQGVAVAQGDYLCILNPDTVVAENTFIQLLAEQEKLVHPGLIGVQLIDGTGKFLSESKRNVPSPATSFRRLFGIQLGSAKNYYADHLHQNQNGKVDVLVGAFMWCQRSLYKEVGGFDEDYFMYGEDIDLSYTIRKMGRMNYYLGKISVIHFKGESTVRNTEYIRRFYGAMRLFYQKHYKRNPITGVMVSAGIQLLSFIQLFANQSPPAHKVDTYYLISDDQELRQKIANVVSVPVMLSVIDSVKDLGDTPITLIFDGDFMLFEEIIFWMTKLNSAQRTFKIRPPGCDFIVGSNYSDSKGSVLKF